jgi:hypothetical protein
VLSRHPVKLTDAVGGGLVHPERRAAGVRLEGRAEGTMIERIMIEAETPGDSRTMFGVRMDDLVIGQNLTAAQAHLIVGEVLDRLTIPRSARKPSEKP